MPDPTLDPATEFEEVPEPVVVPAPAQPAADHAAEIAELKSQLGASIGQIQSLTAKTAVVDQLKELFTGKTADPKDEFVRKEIHRLLPGFDQQSADVGKIKEVLPYILQALKVDADEKVAERAETALDVVVDLAAEYGLDSKDEKVVGYLEEAIAREIKGDPTLLKAWNRGNVKNAVTKAFETVSTKLLAPGRLRSKRSAVSTITESPKSSPRGGPAASPSGGTGKLDFKDTSRDNVNKIHDAAFARLQELTEE
jgi:hypothetical protein